MPDYSQVSQYLGFLKVECDCKKWELIDAAHPLTDSRMYIIAVIFASEMLQNVFGFIVLL